MFNHNHRRGFRWRKIFLGRFGTFRGIFGCNLGLFQRGYREEIGHVEVLRYEDGKTPSSLKLDLWREGLYDTLPKSLFHDKRAERKKRLEAYKQEAEAKRQEQQAARTFFAPLEQGFWHIKLRIEKEERDVLWSFRTRAKLQEMARGLWRFDLGDIPLAYAIPLLHFLPYAHVFKGKTKQLAPLLSILMKVQVEVRQEKGNLVSVDGAALGGILGESRLACDFTLGSTFMEDAPSLVVAIQGLAAAQAANFVPGHYMHHLLHILARFLFHVDAEWRLALAVLEPEQCFVLEDAAIAGHSTNNDYLGYTTYLS